MKKILAFLLTFVMSISLAHARENVTVYAYSGPSSNVVLYVKQILEVANSIQDRYVFDLVSKPGASGLIALQHMEQDPEKNLALVSAGYVDLLVKGRIKNEDYIPLNTLGETCWPLVSPLGDEKKGAGSLASSKKELSIGTVGHGSSSALTAMALGEKLGFTVKTVIFKSNTEALQLMAADGSVDLVLERPINLENFKTKNPNLKALGINCPVRNPKLPHVATLAEQGFSVPALSVTSVASNKMPQARKAEMKKIFDDALLKIGKDKLFDLDFTAPIFRGVPTDRYFQEKNQELIEFRKKFNIDK